MFFGLRLALAALRSRPSPRQIFSSVAALTVRRHLLRIAAASLAIRPAQYFLCRTSATSSVKSLQRRQRSSQRRNEIFCADLPQPRQRWPQTTCISNSNDRHQTSHRRNPSAVCA